MDDLQARLDRAITEARDALMTAVTAEASEYYHYLQEGGVRANWRAAYADVGIALDRYAALVALRARYEGFEDVSVKHRDRDDSRHHQFCPGCAAQRRRIDELTAEAERLAAQGRTHDRRTATGRLREDDGRAA